MEIDVRKFGEEIVNAFLEEYKDPEADTELYMNALRMAADAAAIAIRLYEEKKTK